MADEDLPMYMQVALARQQGVPDKVTAERMNIRPIRVAHLAFYARQRGIDAPKLCAADAYTALRSLQKTGAAPPAGSFLGVLRGRPPEDATGLLKLLDRKDKSVLGMLVRRALEADNGN